MFYIFGLVLHVIFHPDASFAMDTECEINSSCSLSGCHLSEYTDPMTVNPGSNITLNCTIITGGLVRGMTWSQALERVKNSTGLSKLVLEQSCSTKSGGKYSCRCTTIKFASALKIVSPSTTSPNDIYPDKPREIKCTFKGWPLPRTAHWLKNNKTITNGTGEIYHLLQREGHLLKSILRLPPGREDLEGYYVCNATNSIPGWSSNKYRRIQMEYQCPKPKASTISSPEIPVSAFSNVNLTCFIDWHPDHVKYFHCPANQSWYLRQKALPKTGDEKYQQYLEDTSSKCKKKLVLSIFNVTENDKGTYSCHFFCQGKTTTKAATDLIVSVQPPTERPRKWFQHVLISSAGIVCIIVTTLLVWFVMKKKRTSSRIKTKYCPMEKEFTNQLFISHSSKDFGWVTENLISIIEKHSIAYAIHNRDFELGKPIVENMADSVYSSRQVLIALSENYLASNFCREELHMAAQRELYAEDSSLTLVMINKLKKKQLPTALRKKRVLDFDKHKKKQDWEETLLREIVDGELITGV